ncbi:hypothetical protein [Psychroserpens sp. Hel_I_66]|uniref:hypothetical protein n=1 Tax=Psychroserpens sp. Hel_I_66 TaxID=1250004 RepID=UPI00064670F4|nr:hypothetical protein [Psychroserpens sp. Hel_I_66]
MGKKILGYLFLFFGILCVLSFIGNIVSLIIGRKGASTTETFEFIGAIVMTIVLGYVFFKYGSKWTRKKSKVKDEINSIGN